MASLLGLRGASLLNPRDKDEELRRGVARVIAAAPGQTPDAAAAAGPESSNPLVNAAPEVARQSGRAAPQLAAEKWGEYQWRPEFAGRAAQLFNQEANEQIDYQGNLSNINEQFNRALDDTNRLQELAKVRLGNQFASNNSAFSGRRVKASSDLAQNFQRAIGNMTYNKGADESNALANYWDRVNAIRGQAEGLFGDQTAIEQAEQTERARLESEAAAQAEQDRIQREMIAAQEAQTAALNNLARPQVSGPQFSPPGGGGVSAPQGGYTPTTDRTFTLDELEQTFRNATAAGQGFKDRSMGAIESWFNTDPIWAQIARNTANQYGRGNDMLSMQDFFYNPYAWVPGLANRNWPAGVM